MSRGRKLARRAAVTAAVSVVCAALTACSLGPKTEQPATYDLGVPHSRPVTPPGITAIIFVPEITSPVWLSGPGIIYRLNYENAARPQPYALSRWSAAPALLLTERLRARLAAATTNGVLAGLDGVQADYVLRVELEDFSQSFDAPNSSRVMLRARASLVSIPARKLVAQRTFPVEQPAPTPDAPGAVQALNGATEEFLDTVVRWTEERLKAAGKK